MSSLLRQIIILFVLASFLTLIFFGLATMMHGPEGGVQGDCPFSAMGVSLCPQETLAIAIHHISAYQAFINVSVSSSMMVFIISLLLILCVYLTFSLGRVLIRFPVSVFFHNSPPASSYKIKITRWLSLFENSPSYYISA